MTNKNKITSIAPLNYQYQLVSKDSIPVDFNKLIPIDYKKEEIDKYEVLSFHRVMKENYGEPSEIEYEQDSIKELENGSVTAFGREWKYYLGTSSGGLIRVGTEDAHTRLSVYHMLPNNQKEPSNILIQEGNKFINALLREAQKKQKGRRAELILLENVYLINYRRAKLMLHYAEDNERHIKEEVLRYTPGDSLTLEQHAHHDKYMAAVGMYYDAAIFYSYMALEGFVNIVYNALLKDELNPDYLSELKLDERLDIVTKILIMPSVCRGFKSKQKAAFLKILREFTNYRNFLFHSKITDSLKKDCFVESGFLYSCDFKSNSNPLFPERKEHHFVKENVSSIIKIVDYIVKEIIDMMQEESRALVEKYVLDSARIPFWLDKDGVIKFVTLENKQ